MKKTMTILLALGLCAACSKKDDSSNSPAVAKPATKEVGPETGSGSSENLAVEVISLDRKHQKATLGTAVGEGRAYNRACLEGTASPEVKLGDDQTHYRLKKSAASEKTVTLTVEMVVRTASTTLENAKLSANAASESAEDFQKKCGTAAITKIYKGVRVSQEITIPESEAGKIESISLKGMSSDSEEASMADALAALEGTGKNAVSGAKFRTPKVDADSATRSKIEKAIQSAGKDVKILNAMVIAKSILASEKSEKSEKGDDERVNKDAEEVDSSEAVGVAVEAEARAYSQAEKQAAVQPKAEDKGSKSDSKSEAPSENKSDENSKGSSEGGKA